MVSPRSGRPQRLSTMKVDDSVQHCRHLYPVSQASSTSPRLGSMKKGSVTGQMGCRSINLSFSRAPSICKIPLLILLKVATARERNNAHRGESRIGRPCAGSTQSVRGDIFFFWRQIAKNTHTLIDGCRICFVVTRGYLSHLLGRFHGFPLSYMTCRVLWDKSRQRR